MLSWPGPGGVAALRTNYIHASSEQYRIRLLGAIQSRLYHKSRYDCREHGFAGGETVQEYLKQRYSQALTNLITPILCREPATLMLSEQVFCQSARWVKPIVSHDSTQRRQCPSQPSLQPRLHGGRDGYALRGLWAGRLRGRSCFVGAKACGIQGAGVVGRRRGEVRGLVLVVAARFRWSLGHGCTAFLSHAARRIVSRGDVQCGGPWEDAYGQYIG